MEDVKDRRISPPDGGYGWIILLATIVINVTLLPMMQCFGIIFQDKFIEMDVNAASISFLLHLNSSIMCILGLFSGALLNRFSYREICVAGSVLVSLGICLTFFADSYACLLVTTCFLIGSGQGILMPALSLAVNTYFKKRLTLAMTIQVTGASLSPIFMPQLCTYLLDVYGTNGTVLILGGISLHGILGSLMLKPLSDNSINKIIDCNVQIHTLLSKDEQLEKHPANEIISENGASQDLIEKPVLTRNEIYKETTIPKKKQNIWKKLLTLFSLELFNDRVYVILVIGMGISFASELNSIFLMPFVLAELVHFDIENVAFAMSIYGTADIIGRLCVPLLSYVMSGYGPKTFYSAALFISCVGRTVLTLNVNSKISVFFATTLIGYGKGTKAVVQSLIIPHFMPFDKLAAALGLLMTVNGLLSLIIGPIIGLVHDLSESYVPTLHIASILSLFCIILWATDYCLTITKQSPSSNNVAQQL